MVQYGFGWGGSGVEIPPNLTTRFLIKMEKNGMEGKTSPMVAIHSLRTYDTAFSDFSKGVLPHRRALLSGKKREISAKTFIEQIKTHN